MWSDLTDIEFALLKDLARRIDRDEKALLTGNTDRRPMRKLVDLGYAEHQHVSPDSTEMCWITPKGRDRLTRSRWPESAECFCGNGQLWWQPDQKRYMCNARGCGTVMIPDIDLKVVRNARYRLTREETWARSTLDPDAGGSSVDIN